ncbi:MAG: hypothetical protein H5T66_13265 [Chloroflexi bacterium]|nr:hypothetical protein [Chloroflexota bacterium]
MSTFSQLISRIALELGDAEHAIWSEEALTAHLRRALEAYSRIDPRRLDAVIQTEADTREYPLASLGPFLEITDLWYPYNPSAPQHPPERPEWALILSKTFYLGVSEAPSGAESIRLFYTAPHTIAGLDGATETTLDAEGEGIVVLGAGAYAVEARAQALMGAVTVSEETPGQLAAWAEARMRRFAEALQEVRRRRMAAMDARVAVAIETAL